MTKFVRVRSKATGHEFDVPVTHPALGSALTPVKSDRFPPSDKPRQPKHRMNPARPVRVPADPTVLPAPDEPGESPSRSAGHDSDQRKEADHG